MSTEFDWSGLGEISGFGGGYEDACRKMVKAGVEWLREHQNADLKANRISGVFPDLWGGSPDFEALQDAIAKPVDGCTGAMVCAATKHAIFIFKNGWDAYAEKMKKDTTQKN